MLEVGKKAPDFELPDQNGKMHKLSDYAGKKVILYFYPKDNTPGCTKQACGFSASCFIKLGIHRIIKISGRQPVNNAIISQNSQMNSFL